MIIFNQITIFLEMSYKLNTRENYRDRFEAMLIAQIPGNAISDLLYPDFEEMSEIASRQFPQDMLPEEWKELDKITCQICFDEIVSLDYAKNCKHDNKSNSH